MTPAQVAHIMALVQKYGEACSTYTMGAHSAHSINARAAVEAALRDAPQVEPLAELIGEMKPLDPEIAKVMDGKWFDLYEGSAPTAVEPDERAESKGEKS